jgi:uncharacterized membrane protein YagU involved in acid resistance
LLWSLKTKRLVDAFMVISSSFSCFLACTYCFLGCRIPTWSLCSPTIVGCCIPIVTHFLPNIRAFAFTLASLFSSVVLPKFELLERGT